MEAGTRIAIEGVSPELDDGRFAVKRSVGDIFTVEAGAKSSFRLDRIGRQSARKRKSALSAPSKAEAANRPAWLQIPVRGVLDLLSPEGAPRP